MSYQDFSTEPPLKVKINNDILEASQLNSEAYPPNYNVARGFTVFGEACKDECTYRDGSPYTWCHKVTPSSIGTWSGSDYCTSNHKMTHQVSQFRKCHIDLPGSLRFLTFFNSQQNLKHKMIQRVSKICEAI